MPMLLYTLSLHDARPISPTHICCFDVRDKHEVFAQINNLPEEFRNIDILINNAGNAHGLATFDQANLEDLEAMIDINVKGLIYVTKAVLPLMPQNAESHIVNQIGRAHV